MGCCAVIRSPNMNQNASIATNLITPSNSKVLNDMPLVRKTIQKLKKGEHQTLTSNISIFPKEKSSQAIKEIESALTSHFLFKTLDHKSLSRIITELKFCLYEPDQIIFSQGDPGSNFYIIESGRVEIIINNSVKVALKQGDSFGELALLHDSARTATVKSLESTGLWFIQREDFRALIKSISSHFSLENEKFLESLEFFKGLSHEAKDKFVSKATCHEFINGQVIFKEGDPGNIMYVIKAGKVKFTNEGNLIRILQTGEIFGDRTGNYMKTYMVTAFGDVSLLAISNTNVISIFRDYLKALYKNTIFIAFETNPYLKKLNQRQHELIIEKIQVKSYDEGENILQTESAIGKSIFVVLQGLTHHKEICYGRSQIIGITELVTENFVDGETCYADGETLVVGEISNLDLEQCIGGSLQSAIGKNEIFEIIKNIELFGLLPISKIEELSNCIQIANFTDGSEIFSEGESPESCFIVKSGQVKLVKEGVLMSLIIENGHFGEDSILVDQESLISAVAVGDCECWVLARSDFINIIDDFMQTQLLKRLELQDKSITFDNLLIVKHLGTGVLGNVFLAYTKNTKRKYALKTVLRSKISAYNVNENLIMERNVMLQISHPLIIKLVKTFKDPFRVYFLMEYIQGVELYDALKELNLLSNESSKFYIGSILLMLEYLHGKNILYRDLKPENVMIDHEGYPKLIDFGASKVSSERTFTVIGTPHYIAPEVIKGAGYDFSCDLWSLGVMLYEFLIGKLPFGDEEEDLFKIYEAILTGKFSFPKKFEQIQARPFIEILLNLEVGMRKNAQNLQKEKWFVGMNWEYLIGKRLKPPYIPKVNCERIDQYEELQTALKVKNI